MFKGYLCFSLYFLFALTLQNSHAEEATLQPIGSSKCLETKEDCEGFDAIVFVHGIYGNDNTFRNDNGFDWPLSLSKHGSLNRVDIFSLNYESKLFTWAKENNPDFLSLSRSVMDAMAPLRKRKYRSIGFIAHSLGGNVVSTYIHMINTKLGHPQRVQNAFIITLATPVLGSQIADQATVLKTLLGMDDDLLKSLTNNNLYLKMLSEFRRDESGKGERYNCRPVNLHAAYEMKYIGPILAVPENSSALSIADFANSPVVGFNLNHFEISKPSDMDHPVYRWVEKRIMSEYNRLDLWNAMAVNIPDNEKLCKGMRYIPER